MNCMCNCSATIVDICLLMQQHTLCGSLYHTVEINGTDLTNAGTSFWQGLCRQILGRRGTIPAAVGMRSQAASNPDGSPHCLTGRAHRMQRKVARIQLNLLPDLLVVPQSGKAMGSVPGYTLVPSELEKSYCSWAARSVPKCSISELPCMQTLGQCALLVKAFVFVSAHGDSCAVCFLPKPKKLNGTTASVQQGFSQIIC